MKLPFTFGFKFVFRMLIPGFILTLGVWPGLQTVFSLLDLQPHAYTFFIVVIPAGWLLFLLDLPIYMIFEGIRYWPNWLRNPLISSEKRRLERIIKLREKFRQAGNDIERRKFALKMHQFPMNDQGHYYAEFPTRLGNLISSYEDYPKRIYGVDSIIYWYHIWLKIEKDLREEIDSQQAIADSAIYSSFAFYLNGLLFIIYVVLCQFKELPNICLLSPQNMIIVTFVFIFLGWLFYRFSIHLNEIFGRHYKALFDVHQDKIDVSYLIQKMSSDLNDSTLIKLSRKEQLQLVRRYLHTYRIKCTSCGRILCPNQYSSHINGSCGAETD